MAKELYKDNVYAYALYKTLAEVDPPMTVGLYASCNSRIKMILASMEGYMNEAKQNICRPSIGNLISLILRLLFYRPVWTDKTQRTKCKRYVFVRFSAWHFAGSDMLWAGLVMQLCQALQDGFGKLQLSLFRVAQYDKEKDAKPRKTENSSEVWRSKKFCCIPLWALVLTMLMVCLFIVVPVIILSFGKHTPQGDDQNKKVYGAVGGFLIAMLGVPAVGAARFIFILLKSLIFSQDVKVKNALDNKKLSEQLGLMHEVRKEMRILSCFVHFMEHFERQKIKVVLEITNLDRCTPAKIVGVLNAIGILLSDEESPFVSLVAIDPEVLTQKIDQANDCYSKKDRAYGFLDRIITLPFTVPPLCDVSKCKVFEEISSKQSDALEDHGENLDCIKTSDSSEDAPLIQNRLTDISQASSLRANETTYCLFNENDMERSIQEALRSIYLCDEKRLQTYISENTVSMRRVANSIRVSMMVVNTLNVDLPSPERVAAWVVLVDRWPCRLSWILQCMEDEQQTLEADQTTVDSNSSKTLWEVFSEHRIELHVIRAEVEMFLERDDDPELFEMFLRKDYVFTVKEANKLKDCMVNLDCSIKNELARIRQISTLRAIGRSSFNSLSPNAVFNMSVEDICNELSKLKLPERYAEIIKQNDINGQTLLLSDPADLRRVMQMTLGEWTAFRIRFLGVISWDRLSKTKAAPVISNPNAICCDPVRSRCHANQHEN
ncbi:NTPase KAP family P-loop domain-containing protein 1 isoform X2 [Silurus meridionalis]|uniref:NTPase KAP family P-loop domain-containing protein 1 isoform X2 n=1 Tax=Silurus meridionalis TaxID=175797 RepID=UPI001EEB8C12|nr:NTPase KAP family P-loop domain-containing protein 1 isoform X2 [Silurus meridionalis]XP_046714447.1 NTPase KAP family P-loop domain-containing protein 1 isoform X2 [Silurus meridionalis]